MKHMQEFSCVVERGSNLSLKCQDKLSWAMLHDLDKKVKDGLLKGNWIQRRLFSVYVLFAEMSVSSDH